MAMTRADMDKDNWTGSGKYRIYYRYQRQAEHCDKEFATKQEAEEYLARIERMGYLVRKVCRLCGGERE
jgi:hypothetical protein